MIKLSQVEIRLINIDQDKDLLKEYYLPASKFQIMNK